jgi:hypothetical protein
MNSATQNKEIIIPYGINIFATYNYDWNKYLPVIPKDLNTISDSTTYYSPTNNVLFDYFRNSQCSQLGVKLRTNDNIKDLFLLDKGNNNKKYSFK